MKILNYTNEEMKMDEEKHSLHIRYDEKINLMIKDLMGLEEQMFNNKNHLIRCAIIRMHKEIMQKRIKNV